MDVTLDTAGEPLRAWLYPRIAKVKVVAEDVESKEVVTDMVFLHWQMSRYSMLLLGLNFNLKIPLY